MRQQHRLSFGVIFSLFVFPLVAPPSWGAVECGATIEPGEVAVLTKDLTCTPGDTGGAPAITIRGPKAGLKMAGHTVTCDGLDFGILLEGSEVVLVGGLFKHGTVTGCNATGVRLVGTGHHHVTKVKVVGNASIGFWLNSDNNVVKNTISQGNSSGTINHAYQFNGTNGNTLKGNLAEGYARAFFGSAANDTTLIGNRAVEPSGASDFGGFTLRGDRNYLAFNQARNILRAGSHGAFYLEGGNDNKYLYNRAIGNRRGFTLLGGLMNTVRGNTAKPNIEEGIWLQNTVQDSTVVGNVARNNGVDLRDDNLNCDNNTWKFNWFQTSQTNPPEAGCIR